MMDVKGQVHQYPYCTLPSEGMIECWKTIQASIYMYQLLLDIDTYVYGILTVPTEWNRSSRIFGKDL